MNNLNVIGQYLTSMQQSINALANSSQEVRNEIAILKRTPAPPTVEAPSDLVRDIQAEINVVKQSVLDMQERVKRLEEMNVSLESIFSTLQPAMPASQDEARALHEASQEKCIDNDEEHVLSPGDDIVLLHKKTTPTKKKTLKKKGAPGDS